MDANKFEKLRKINYTIRPSCGLCVHSHFSNSNSDWGVCTRQFYEHKKHKEERRLSIHRAGYCNRFGICEKKEANMQHYKEFIKGDSK